MQPEGRTSGMDGGTGFNKRLLRASLWGNYWYIDSRHDNIQGDGQGILYIYTWYYGCIAWLGRKLLFGCHRLQEASSARFVIYIVINSKGISWGFNGRVFNSFALL